ncbi:MAG: hypothetical protein M3457_01140 [Chloroflexota bacterium]|nr:hypothetical protein [Chloroflexota bacterium]
MRCGAKTKNSGAPCKSRAMPNGRCRMHGGKSLVGPASGTYKDGIYSKVLPTRLLRRYQDARSDTELLALRDQVALIDTRLYDVLGRVESGESSQLWRELRSAYTAMQAAQKNGDTASLRLALVEIGDLIERGHGDWAAWADVRSLIRDRKSLVESERKRLVEMQQMVTSTQAMTLVTALVEAVHANVTDPDALRAISAAVVRLVGRADDAQPSIER